MNFEPSAPPIDEVCGHDPQNMPYQQIVYLTLPSRPDHCKSGYDETSNLYQTSVCYNTQHPVFKHGRHRDQHHKNCCTII
jgi:hypothetical protein